MADRNHRPGHGRRGGPGPSPEELERLLGQAAPPRRGRGWLLPMVMLLVFGGLLGFAALQAAATFRALRGAFEQRQELAERLAPQALLDPRAQITPSPLATPLQAPLASSAEATPAARPAGAEFEPATGSRPAATADGPATTPPDVSAPAEAEPVGGGEPVQARLAAARRIALGLTVASVLLLGVGAWRLLGRR